MSKIAVFTNRYSALCDFFEADRFLIFERGADDWQLLNEIPFAPIPPLSAVLTRKNSEALLPLLNGCKVLAGGTLVGIPFFVFDRAGLHIFEISAITDEVFDEIFQEMQASDAAINAREAIISNARPKETGTPGIYFLDLIALQSECPEVSSKKAMADFLENTPFLELNLICRHIPPWIEDSGIYRIDVVQSENGIVKAIVSRKC